MRIKVSCPEFGTRVVTVSNDCVVSELLKTVSEELELGKPFASCRFGYPPQVVDLTQETNLGKKLEDLGIASGEKVNFTLESTSAHSLESPSHEVPRKLKENQISLQGIWSDRILQIHAVPDDNSCMFHAISYCIHGDLSHSQVYREIVASEVAADPMEYSDAILGRPNREYSQWILKKSSWGGGIELAVLSKVLQLSVYVLDVDAAKFEKFNEQRFSDFIMVAFNGVHYDAMEVLKVASGEKLRVLNQGSDRLGQVLERAQDVALDMKKRGYSFNTARDRIKCNVCSEIIIGEREAARHAEKTGHVDFGQSS
ncbi:LADA_0C11914g1_1 [Lachancea dasiensis]|uniref:Ubiquitin thioesterase OTU n=1 Tax=Lachancea dasiensis TaxID=1072105 RepID=A0A1G4J269_9SACH|nr:LADA_0C11914g1_1 [Lachancea dasiensis]